MIDDLTIEVFSRQATAARLEDAAVHLKCTVAELVTSYLTFDVFKHTPRKELYFGAAAGDLEFDLEHARNCLRDWHSEVLERRIQHQ